MPSGFAAMLSRMSYITRWGLMRNTREETLSEHSLVTAATAHLLACAARELFGAADVDPDRVACRALYHDAPEILTGDLPTPVKYSNQTLRSEYRKVEEAAEHRLLALLPDELRGALEPAITGSDLSERERRIVKAADKLSALFKCIEEESNGNGEFKSAKASTLALLNDDPLPETGYFLREFLPAFSLTLDELLKS